MYPKVELGRASPPCPARPGPAPPYSSWWSFSHCRRPRHTTSICTSGRPRVGLLHATIQGQSSPQPRYQQGAVESSSGQDPEPGFPALGTAWTPMKTSSGEAPSPLEKELREVFETEAPKSNIPSECVLPLEAPSFSELDVPLGTQFSLEDQMPPWSQTELPSRQLFSEEETGQPSETLMTSQGSDKPWRDPETPRSPGS